MSQRISFLVEGHVQGVFFRKFTQMQAKSIGVTGFVKNDTSGSVSGEAQGNQDQIERFVQQLQLGPKAAKVEKCEYIMIEAKEPETGFEISR
ncbi:Acylphosphatase-like domain-containing protein [Flagelloscypha sp. PMI_526]|nr:Acylphosphatase-like domain-containing protein [Flagelloscypha sp. PMI_526]